VYTTADVRVPSTNPEKCWFGAMSGWAPTPTLVTATAVTAITTTTNVRVSVRAIGRSSS
jgi:hypothetical protein